MPLPMMDLKGFSSSSHFSEDVPFPGERQVGFWNTMHDKIGAAGGTFVSSTQPKLMQVQSWTSTSPHNRELFPMQEQIVNLNLGMMMAEPETAASRSLASSKSTGHDPVSRYSLSARTASYFTEGGGITLMGTQHENSLFSSSMSELFCRKMKLTPNNGIYGHSIGTVASHFEEEEPIESLEEIEAQTIGNLLPDDDDLLSGVTDGLGFALQSKESLEIEESDIFSTVGGMDLEEYGSSEGLRKFEYPMILHKNPLESNGSVNGEHPYGEHPSRTLFVRNINSNVEDSELHALFEQFGDIRTLYTACKHRGFVMISYYDIRAARTAMTALQHKPIRRRKLDIHYSIPKDNTSGKDINQGSRVVFNLDSFVSNEELHHIFAVFGEIKEIRETPHTSNQKFVEYYDVRAAEAALRELNKRNIAGKQIKLEPSRPGGARRSSLQGSLELEQDEFDRYVKENYPTNNSSAGLSGPHTPGAFTSTIAHDILGTRPAIQSPVLETASYHGISSSVPNSLPSLSRPGPVGTHPGLTESRQSLGQLKFDIQTASSCHPHSLPEYHDVIMHGIQSSSPNLVEASINSRSLERTDRQHRAGLNGCSLELNDGGFGSTGMGSCSVPGQYTWGNSYQPPSMMWPNSPSLVNGFCTPGSHAPPRVSGIPGAPSQMLNTVMPLKAHHVVGSSPSVNSLWDRHQAYAGESPKTSTFHPVSLGNMRIPSNSLHSVDFTPQNKFPHIGGSIDIPVASKNVIFQSQQQRNVVFPGSGRGQMMPIATSYDPPNERIRSRRNEGASTQADSKKLYELDTDRILRGEDTRTTLMIKNIPNKYTSKMLLAAIDEYHRGTYDFIYLPIDFKNKCNVGYAFINMADPNKIISFYKAFHGKKWEKFNSEKVAYLAYARIQGKGALIAHFQNSSLMNEDKRCRPILFNTEGPNAGDQVPFPMGINIRTRPGKPRTNIVEENNQGNRASFTNGEDRSKGDTSVGCLKDSD